MAMGHTVDAIQRRYPGLDLHAFREEYERFGSGFKHRLSVELAAELQHRDRSLVTPCAADSYIHPARRPCGGGAPTRPRPLWSAICRRGPPPAIGLAPMQRTP